MIIKTVDFHIESYGERALWGTLTLPDIQGDKPPIVMAHGFLGFKDWAFFPWLSDQFAAAGFPVVRFNFSGSGMGPQVDGSFEDAQAFRNDTISNQVEDLRSVVSCVISGKFEPDLPRAKKVLLWGHSRGGAICFLAAGNTPEVAGIATWATVARVNRYLYEVKQNWRKHGYTSVESSRTGQTLESSAAFLDDVEKWGAQGDIPTFLHHLKVPVLLVHGAEDISILPDESESLAAIYPRAKLAILAGANHKFNVAHPFTGPSSVLSEAAHKTLEFYKSL